MAVFVLCVKWGEEVSVKYFMSLETAGSVQAQTMDTGLAYEPEESYVVMGEDIEKIEEIIGTEITEEGSIETGEEEIVTLELSEDEAEALEELDVVIEEDILFSASSLNNEGEEGETELQDVPETEQASEVPGEQETSETQDDPKEPESIMPDMQDTEAGGEQGDSEALDTGAEPGDTETEESETPEEKENTEETESTEEPEDTEEEDTEEEENTEEGLEQRTEKADARDDWNIAAVHGESYTGDKAQGEPIKIAVLDSGVNYRENLPVYGHVTELKGAESNPFFEDATGHGTAVASLIASNPDEESIQGMNEDAAVYSVQVLNENNAGTLSGVVQGIYWAIENDMDIINMSFGTPHSSEILEKAVEDAREAGILLVAAAGNDPEGAVEYPAAYEGVCAVGSSNLEGEIASESTRGKDVDIYAPGAGILVNAPLFGTQIESGSSLACAQVSAAASLLWEKDRTRDAEFIRRLMEETANVGIDPEYGKGLLDVEQAMEEFDSFVPGEQEKAVEEKVQEKPLLEFDEGEIRALWKDSDHQKMIPSGINLKGYKTMYAMAAYPDTFFVPNSDKENPLHKDRRFHGSYNYIATLKFLVDLANQYYNKGNTDAVYAWAKGNTLLKKDNKYGDIVDNVKWFLKQKICPNLNEQEETTRRNKAYKIMGLVIHLVGDVYAHRTRVTSAMLQNARNTGSSSGGYFVKSDFTDWNKFQKDVKDRQNVKENGVSKGIEFRFLAGDKNKQKQEKYHGYQREIGNSKLYEDNVKIESWRYSTAKKVVNDLIREDSLYNFRDKAWSKGVMRRLGDLCGNQNEK